MASSKTQNHFHLAKKFIDFMPHRLRLCSYVITASVNKTRLETLTDVCPAISKQNVKSLLSDLHQATGPLPMYYLPEPSATYECNLSCQSQQRNF